MLLAMMDTTQLNQRFGVGDSVVFDNGPGGLVRARLAGRGGRAAVLLHGAHVTEFVPDGEGGQPGRPVLWMSRKSWFQPGKPIRGGVPVCWPWFSNEGPAADCPNHGFARLAAWRVQAASLLADGRATIRLGIGPDDLDDNMRRWWPHRFELTFTLTVGADLTMELTTANLDDTPFTITEALHSYFAVSDVRNVRVLGLEGAEYLDTVPSPFAPCQQDDQPIAFAAETDRDYLDSAAACELVDEAWTRKIVIAKSGSRSTVVWNPWAAKAVRMADFDDHEWPGMLCVESANIRAANAVTVAPGESHTLRASYAIFSTMLPVAPL